MRIVTFYRAAAVPVEDMTTQLAGNRPGGTSQIERFPGLADPDQIDLAVTEDLFEGSRTDPGTGQDRHSHLTICFCCGARVDGDGQIDRTSLP